MNWEEACRILGVETTATDEQIHEQYLYKVQLLHPDWNSNKPANVRKLAEQELKLINAAYNVLKTPTNKTFSTPPKLDISLKKIRFKDLAAGESKSTTFEVKNQGGAYSKIWIDDSPAPWLKVTDVKSLTSDLLPVKVTIEASGTGKSDEHLACNLAVRLENEQNGVKDEAVVRVELWMKAEPGTLKVSGKNTIKFNPGKGTRQKTFQLSNIGAGTLQGHLSTTRSWLLVSPNIVTIDPSFTITYNVTVANEARHQGLADKAFINIITDGGNDRITVQVSTMYSTLRKFYRRLCFSITGLLYLAPLAIVPTQLSANYWPEPLFWTAVSIYFALAGSISYPLCRWQNNNGRKG